MLTTLRIKNLALVADLTLELQPALNIVTGETGAGKSILIGALNLILGQRADRTLIRSGSESCSVEALFNISHLKAPLGKFLDANGLEPCEEGQLLVKRTFSSTGSSRQFVNGSPATLSLLTTLGEWLIDIHGPHDHQSLLHSGRQLDILDAFGRLGRVRERFTELLQRRGALQEDKASLITDEKTYAAQLDLLRFQVSEIGSAKLHAEEEAHLEENYHRTSHAAKLLELAQTALRQLGDDDQSLLTQAGALGRTLLELERIDPGATAMAEPHAGALGALRELQTQLSHYADRLEIDPERLRDMEQRLNLLHGLKRKYGSSLREVIVFGEEAKSRLLSLEKRDTELAQINHQLQELEVQMLSVGRELSTARRKLIPQLRKAVTGQLDNLGFQQSHFDIGISSETGPADSNSKINPSGLDEIDFLFAPNPGEPARPLRAIASSGEMARVMLALKTVLAAEDEVPVLVFDEVDANIGGETGNIVGEKLAQIARQRQVLCITHLPQVAAHASAHYLVSKQIKGGRSISEISLLDNKTRVTELARMLGGQSDVARKHAQTLLEGNRREAGTV